MLKLGAKFILTTMIIPLVVYASKVVISNKERIIILEVKNKTQIELLKELKQDIKDFRQEFRETK